MNEKHEKHDPTKEYTAIGDLDSYADYLAKSGLFELSNELRRLSQEIQKIVKYVNDVYSPTASEILSEESTPQCSPELSKIIKQMDKGEKEKEAANKEAANKECITAKKETAILILSGYAEHFEKAEMQAYAESVKAKIREIEKLETNVWLDIIAPGKIQKMCRDRGKNIPLTFSLAGNIFPIPIDGHIVYFDPMKPQEKELGMMNVHKYDDVKVEYKKEGEDQPEDEKVSQPEDEKVSQPDSEKYIKPFSLLTEIDTPIIPGANAPHVNRVIPRKKGIELESIVVQKRIPADGKEYQSICLDMESSFILFNAYAEYLEEMGEVGRALEIRAKLAQIKAQTTIPTKPSDANDINLRTKHLPTMIREITEYLQDKYMIGNHLAETMAKEILSIVLEQ